MDRIRLFVLTALPSVAKALPLFKPTEDDEGEGFSLSWINPALGILFWILFIVCMRKHYSQRIFLSNSVPGGYDDEYAEAEEDARALEELSPNEQELYFQAKDFQRLNPLDTQELSLSHLLLIQEKGVGAWEFKPNVSAADEVNIESKTEINFLNQGSELSVQTNLPIPKASEVYYFESKIYDIVDPDNTTISIGLATYPYPYFRLPGRQRYSLAYDSTGDRRYNQPFTLQETTGLGIFPKMERGDVIGVGYRTRSGTVFFTRNGKKLSESKVGGHIKGWKMKLWPVVGANNPCSVHVNFGQAGYVFIEGNVKKWGFAPLEGNGPPPPEYSTFSNDVLLESSDVDPQDLMSREGDFPPNFWDVADFTEREEDDEDITLRSIAQVEDADPPTDPPNYSSNESDDE